MLWSNLLARLEDTAGARALVPWTQEAMELRHRGSVKIMGESVIYIQYIYIYSIYSL